MTNLVSLSTFAKDQETTRQAAQYWKSQGWLVLSGDLVDVDASVERLKQYRPKGAKTPAKSAASDPAKDPASTPQVTEFEADAESAASAMVASLDNLTIEEAKRLKEVYLARLAQLEYDTKSGRVVEAAAVAEKVGAEYSEVRTKLLAIPAEQATSIHRCRTVAEVQDKLRDIITRILEGLTADKL